MRAGAFTHLAPSSHAAAANQALADRIGQHATGALAAQRVKHRIREGADTAEAFDRLLELADAHGVNSAAVAGYVAELAKAVRG